MKTVMRVCCAGLIAAAVAGCNNEKSVSYKDVSSDPMPELQGLAQTDKEFHNDFAMSSSVDLQLFWDDLARTFYTNSPSRLSPYPVVTTGGQPR